MKLLKFQCKNCGNFIFLRCRSWLRERESHENGQETEDLGCSYGGESSLRSRANDQKAQETNGRGQKEQVFQGRREKVATQVSVENSDGQKAVALLKLPDLTVW
jgi:hypothetical protein